MGCIKSKNKVDDANILKDVEVETTSGDENEDNDVILEDIDIVKVTKSFHVRTISTNINLSKSMELSGLIGNLNSSSDLTTRLSRSSLSPHSPTCIYISKSQSDIQ